MTRRALTTLVAIVALAVVPLASGGGTAPVQDGRYAGGGNRVVVFFNVNDRTIPFVRVRAERLSNCAVNGPGVFGSTVVDPSGRFVLKDASTFPTNTLRVTGRFATRNQVTGKVKWKTTDDCPAGTYRFKFRANRYGPIQ